MLSSAASLSGSTYGDENDYSIHLDLTGNEPLVSWKMDWGDGVVDTITDDRRTLTHRYDGYYYSRTVAPKATVTTSSRTYSVQGPGLDPNFGTWGKATFNPTTGRDQAYAMAVQGDGKVLQAGVYNGVDFGVCRFNSNGSVDTSFGINGIAYIDFSAGTDYAYAIGLQSDGKIVIGGSATIGSSTDFALARFNTNGTLDTTFGTNGKVTTNFSGSDNLRAIAIQGDDKIVAAGSAANESYNSSIAIARYNVNGSLDTSFDSDGKKTIDLSSWDDGCNAVAVQSWDNKIVLGGKTLTNGSTYDFALVRLNASGTFDTYFGTGGIVTTDFTDNGGSRSDVVYSMSVQYGTILLAGESDSSYGYSSPALARYYSSDGSLLTNFGVDGKVMAPGSEYVNVYAVAQDSAHITVAGRVLNSTGSNYDMFVRRYDTSGNIASDFGSSGTMTADFTNITGIAREDSARAMTILDDGRILTGGYAMMGNTDGAYALACFQPTKYVTIDNVAPTATITGGDCTIKSGNTVTISLTNPSDPSTADTNAGFHYSFQATGPNGIIIGTLEGYYVDASTNSSMPFTFTESGTYTITGRIFDKDDGYSEYTTTVIVDGTIQNGSIRLGVDPYGNLVARDGSGTYTGLRFLDTPGNDPWGFPAGEALASQFFGEGWGVSDNYSGVSGYAEEYFGRTYNLTLQSFSETNSTATSVVIVGNSLLRVTHQYTPVSNNLYEISVSIENISTSNVDLHYRRVMDWDVAPTRFNEFVTVVGGTGIYTNNNGFASPDPLASATANFSGQLYTGTFTTGVSQDQGALFDFNFGQLAPGATKRFKLYYGATATQPLAMTELNAVGAQVYSLGMSSTTDGQGNTVPNYTGQTFIFGFKDII